MPPVVIIIADESSLPQYYKQYCDPDEAAELAVPIITNHASRLVL